MAVTVTCASEILMSAMLILIVMKYKGELAFNGMGFMPVIMNLCNLIQMLFRWFDERDGISLCILQNKRIYYD
jgi:hypothetical protein